MSDAVNAPAAAPAHDETPMTDHAYDGICEYDNPMPGWWVWIFWGTIVFSGFYFFLATAVNLFSPVGEYDRAVAIDLRKQMDSGLTLSGDAPTLLRLSHDDESLKFGQNVFQGNCIACHGKDGNGTTGPNLTDDNYVHVGKIEDIFDVVRQGRNNGAMPAWSNRLNPKEIVTVSSYVASLRGQNKPGRPPEGKPIPQWSATDSAPATPASPPGPAQGVAPSASAHE
jgi:cytochrome c oxidase cbb3-type subunit 3